MTQKPKINESLWNEPEDNTVVKNTEHKVGYCFRCEQEGKDLTVIHFEDGDWLQYCHQCIIEEEKFLQEELEEEK